MCGRCEYGGLGWTSKWVEWVLQQGPDGLRAFAASPGPGTPAGANTGGPPAPCQAQGGGGGFRARSIELELKLLGTCPLSLSLSRGRSFSIEPKLGGRPAAVAGGARIVFGKREEATE